VGVGQVVVGQVGVGQVGIGQVAVGQMTGIHFSNSRGKFIDNNLTNSKNDRNFIF
jgi:hypothetical protein